MTTSTSPTETQPRSICGGISKPSPTTFASSHSTDGRSIPPSEYRCEVGAAKTHRDRCREEGTRDVIFLFQVRQVIPTDVPSGCVIGDEGILESANLQGPYLTGDQLLDRECAIETWRTASVWLTREEAEAFGERNRHNYGEKDKGWMVYGVPAEGCSPDCCAKRPDTSCEVRWAVHGYPRGIEHIR